jgi:hypothetical protein
MRPSRANKGLMSATGGQAKENSTLASQIEGPSM